MKKGLLAVLFSAALICAGLASTSQASNIDLAKSSTLEQIIQGGEILVCLDVCYVPFDMSDKTYIVEDPERKKIEE